MPFNSVEEKKRVKLSFSLKRKNAAQSTVDSKILKPNVDLKEPTKTIELSDGDNKENRPAKRQRNSTYLNTLNASKRLKCITGGSRHTGKSAKVELEVLDVAPLSRVAMLNGHHQPENQYGGNPTTKKSPVATLSNLGNTCFLNSVLYTLRYAPRFLHNLHHLVSDLASVEQKLGSIRLKSSSLGRSAAGLAYTGTRSWSSKDLLSLGQPESSAGKSKIQIATEKLHETYAHLRSAESKSLAGSSEAPPEPYAADAFLQALRDVNSTFEGNRQQDAHELLICILNNIRETCRALGARAERLNLHENGDSNGIARQPSPDGDSGKPSLAQLRKSWKKRRDKTERHAPPADRDREGQEGAAPAPAAPPAPGADFVADDFEGTMIMRTQCLECETVAERRQVMSDVCVPVQEEPPPPQAGQAEPFHLDASEYLRDQNKYWCGVCLRYVEARRTVGYERLPRLLVLQLKRFSGGMQKITRHIPTPTSMPCFCEPCARRHPDPPQHRYVLWAVIMHLGQSLSGGHYVAYARECGGATAAGADCERGAAPAPPGSSFMRFMFNRPRHATQGCAAAACCVPRARAPGWLACDDELVRPLSDDEFAQLLSAESRARSAATPYLLFYVKSEGSEGPIK